jgi:hypothetical protein
MAGSNHFLNDLRRQLERLDDAGFAALASTGLLRRARKDLESQSPELATGEDVVRIKLTGNEVTLDARGPAHARCTCPSKTTCQHILAACLFLKSLPDDGSGGASENGPDQAALTAELLAISPDVLVRYAGRPAVRDALQSLETDDAAQVSFAQAIVIRLARTGVEFRYVGGGPDSLITEFRGRSVRKLAAQAILSFQQAHGVHVALPGGEAQRKRASAAPTEDAHLRETLLAKVERLLRECVHVGLAHLSDSFVERLQALATVAEGARLHRLSLMLSRLSSHADLILERHARADSGGLFVDLATTYALVSALSDPASRNRVELVGEARSSYDEVASLDLYCAGAYPWQTQSGYWGLTTIFWSPPEARWLSHSDARPVGTLGFTPKDAYRMNGPWRGCPSPEQIMGRWVTLKHASVNRMGRLSGGDAPSAEVKSAERPDFTGHSYRNWADLRAYGRASLDGVGLMERNPHTNYVVLYPWRLLPCSFEDATQTLLWPVEDEEGKVLLLRLEYSMVNAPAVERVDALRSEPGVGILAQLNWSAGRLSARPLTLLRQGEAVVDNLFLDRPPAVSRTQALLDKLRATLGGQPSSRAAEPTLQPMDATERMLVVLDELLLNIAERGAASGTPFAQELVASIRRLHDSGLTLFDPDTRIDSEAVLRTRYLSQVARACLARE